MKTQNMLVAGLLLAGCAGTMLSPAVLAAGNGSPAGMAAYAALSKAEGDALVFMREEEKLARDVYLTLYQKWAMPVFQNIAGSEQQHTDRIRMLLSTYGLADPVKDGRVGAFTNPQLASLYAQLVEQGKKSLPDALKVGALIEETDIGDLQKALQDTTRPDIVMVYSNLMRGSRNHLRAFVGQITRSGGVYTAQALPQSEVDAIVNSEFERGNGGGMGGGRGFGRGGRW
jgi:hypothetical protein